MLKVHGPGRRPHGTRRAGALLLALGATLVLLAVAASAGAVTVPAASPLPTPSSWPPYPPGYVCAAPAHMGDYWYCTDPLPASPTATDLILTPPSGDTRTTNVTFTSPASCPAGSETFLVRVGGPNVPADVNALGVNEIPAPAAPVQAYPMGNTFENLFAAQGVAPPVSGPLTFTLLCLAAGQITGDFTVTVTFTPTTGTASSYAVGPAATTAPQSAVQFLLSVPDPPACDGPPSLACGALALTVDTTGEVRFGDPQLALVGGQAVRTATAALSGITVLDSRPGFLPWQLSGRLDDFATVAGRSIPADHAGWKPAIRRPGGGAVPGAAVEPGFPSTVPGLGIARLLGSAPGGHNGSFDPAASTEFGGSVTVRLPLSTPGGDYRSRLTLTLIG